MRIIYTFRIFWSISFVISITLTSVLIFELLQKYGNFPIIIEIDENQILIEEIFFPAVTICPSLIHNIPHIKTVDYSKITNAITIGEIDVKNLTLNELKYMQVISLVSRDGFLSKLNVSVPTDDFIEKLHEFPSFWQVDEEVPPISDSGFGNWSQVHAAK